MRGTQRYGGGEVEQSLVSSSFKTLKRKTAVTVEQSTAALKNITDTDGIWPPQTLNKTASFEDVLRVVWKRPPEQTPGNTCRLGTLSLSVGKPPVVLFHIGSVWKVLMRC